jgi:hypothetical protein
MPTPLDSDLIPYNKVTFNVKTEAMANPQAVGFAWPMFIVSIICFITLNPASILIGAFLFLLSSFVLFSYRGVNFDLNRKMFMEYSAYFGIIKTGTWKNTDAYPFVSVLSKQLANQLKFGLTFRYRDFGIYLLSNDHRIRIKIAEANDESSALSTANAIADKLDKACTVYNPPQRAGRSSRRRR